MSRAIDPRYLIDLFLDDELPVELASEFKQAMFEDASLREDVARQRQAREALEEAYAGDSMTEAEKERVKRRVLELAGTVQRHWNTPQLELPLQRDQLHLRLISE